MDPRLPPPGCTERCRKSPTVPAACQCACKGTWHSTECPPEDRHVPAPPRRRKTSQEKRQRRRQVRMSWDRPHRPPLAVLDPAQLEMFGPTDVGSCPVQSTTGDA